jgi:hypothetical protein
MLALQRGASNLYFANVASSILIPPHSTKIGRILATQPRYRSWRSTSHKRNSDALFEMAAHGRVDWRELKKPTKHDVDRERFRRHRRDELPPRGIPGLQRDRREEGDELEKPHTDTDDYGPLVKEAFSS